MPTHFAILRITLPDNCTKHPIHLSITKLITNNTTLSLTLPLHPTRPSLPSVNGNAHMDLSQLVGFPGLYLTYTNAFNGGQEVAVEGMTDLEDLAWEQLDVCYNRMRNTGAKAVDGYSVQENGHTITWGVAKVEAREGWQGTVDWVLKRDGKVLSKPDY